MLRNNPECTFYIYISSNKMLNAIDKDEWGYCDQESERRAGDEKKISNKIKPKIQTKL